MNHLINVIELLLFLYSNARFCVLSNCKNIDSQWYHKKGDSGCKGMSGHKAGTKLQVGIRGWQQVLGHEWVERHKLVQGCKWAQGNK